MKCFVGPVDAVGNLWMIRPGPSRGKLRLERAGVSKERAEVHVSRPAALDEAVLGAIRDGRAVAVLERAAAFAARVDRLAVQLEEEGDAVEWIWAELHEEAAEHIDDERGALAWFLREPAEVLVVESVAFQKRRAVVSLRLERARVEAARVARLDRSVLH